MCAKCGVRGAGCSKTGSSHCTPPRFAPRTSHYFIGLFGSGTTSSNRAVTLSASIPSASARKFTSTRCLSTGAAAALDTAELRRLTADHGLSLGDRACLALAKALGGTAVTADRNWTQIGLDIDVRLIR